MISSSLALLTAFLLHSVVRRATSEAPIALYHNSLVLTAYPGKLDLLCAVGTKVFGQALDGYSGVFAQVNAAKSFGYVREFVKYLAAIREDRCSAVLLGVIVQELA